MKLHECAVGFYKPEGEAYEHTFYNTAKKFGDTGLIIIQYPHNGVFDEDSYEEKYYDGDMEVEQVWVGP